MISAPLESRDVSIMSSFCTGPDAIGDHKTKILDAQAIGVGTISREGTSDSDYILRAATVRHTIH